MQHLDKHTCNICLKKRRNIENRNLQDMCTTITTYATFRSNFTTSIRNTWNIPSKHLKQLKCTLVTCVFHPSSMRRRAERGMAGSGHRWPRMVAWPHNGQLRRNAPLSWRLGWVRRRTEHSIARRGRRCRYSRRAPARSLEAEGEAPTNGPSNHYSRWGGWQRTLTKDSSSLRGTKAPRGTSRAPRGMAAAARRSGLWREIEAPGRWRLRRGEAETARDGVRNFVFYERDGRGGPSVSVPPNCHACRMIPSHPQITLMSRD
jgi:hypothetical protein